MSSINLPELGSLVTNSCDDTLCGGKKQTKLKKNTRGKTMQALKSLSVFLNTPQTRGKMWSKYIKTDSKNNNSNNRPT